MGLFSRKPNTANHSNTFDFSELQLLVQIAAIQDESKITDGETKALIMKCKALLDRARTAGEGKAFIFFDGKDTTV